MSLKSVKDTAGSIADKRDKFILKAEGLTSKAIKAIDLILPITDTALFQYSQKDRDAILLVLRDRVKNLEDAFVNGGPKSGVFKLPK